MSSFPNVPPDSATVCNVSCRVLSAAFGDGYEQVAADGINSVREEMVVEWTNISVSDYESIVQYLESKAGHTPFSWAPPDTATPKQWTCRQWQKKRTSPVTYQITARFVQSFGA